MYSYSFFPKSKLIVVVFRGIIKLPEIMEYFMSIVQSPDFSKEYNGVADWRDAQLSLKPDDLAVFSPANEKNLTEGHWAFLVSDPKTTALSFLIKNQTTVEHPLQIFSEPETASGYLGIDVEPFIREVTATI